MSLAAQEFLAGAAPPEKREAAEAHLADLRARIPAKRMRSDGVDIDRIHETKRTDAHNPLEKDILRAILAALRIHPRVAFVGRFNRGAIQSSYNGNTSYTQFNTVPGFPDIHGMLRGGAAFYIECKRLGGKTSDKQSNFLGIIAANGGICGVATSVEEALRIIDGASPGI